MDNFITVGQLRDHADDVWFRIYKDTTNEYILLCDEKEEFSKQPSYPPLASFLNKRVLLFYPCFENDEYYLEIILE